MGGVPHDSGWAWLVCLGAAVNLFFVTGGLRSVGLVFIEIIEKYEASRTMTSLTLGFMGAGFGILSPVGSALGMRFAMRSVVFTGGFVAALSSILTAFSPSIFYVIIVYGIFTGVGYGLMFGPSFVMIGLYFDKRRSLANGLAAAGGSLGQLILPLLITQLMKHYAFAGCMLIMGAVTLHSLPASLLFRPLSAYRTPSKRDPGFLNVNSGTLSANRNDADPSSAENGKDDHANTHKQRCCGDTLPIGNEEALELEYKTPEDNPQVSPLIWETRSETCSANQTDKKNTNALKSNSESLQLDSDLSKSQSSLHESDNSVAVGQDIPVSLSDGECGTHSGSKTAKKGFFSLFDLALFSNALFIIYIVGLSCGHAGYVNLCMFLPSFANEEGVGKDRLALLLSLIGISDLFGRILGGWFADMGLVKRSNIMAVCLTFTGTCAILVPFVPIFPVFLVLCIIIGLIGGVYVSLMSVVAIDFLGLHRLASSFGLAMMFMGLCSIPVPIIIGFMKDTTGSFGPAIRFCGALMVTGGFSFAMEPVARGIENRKEQTQVRQTN